MRTTTSNFVFNVPHHGKTTVCILRYFGRISSRIPRISKYQKLSAHGVDIKLRIMSLSQFNSIWASTAFQYKFFHPMLLFYVFKILVLDIFVSILFLFIRKTETNLFCLDGRSNQNAISERLSTQRVAQLTNYRNLTLPKQIPNIETLYITFRLGNSNWILMLSLNIQWKGRFFVLLFGIESSEGFVDCEFCFLFEGNLHFPT